MRSGTEIKETISQIQAEMEAKAIDAYIVTMVDDHISEYVAAQWKRIAYLSGFSGSAGTLVISTKGAALWVDGRYFIQAVDELEGSDIVMMKDRTAGAPTISDWILERYGRTARVAADGRTVSIHLAKTLEANFTAIDYSLDLVSPYWTDRPVSAVAQVFEHELVYTGLSRAEKLGQYREKLDASVAASLVTGLDDIAWLLNIRGGDIAFNPVTYAFLYLDDVSGTLFIDPNKISEAIESALAADGISLRPYDDVYDFVKQIDAEKVPVLQMDPTYSNVLLKEVLSDEIKLVLQALPTVALKGTKNETEIKNLWETAVTEGLALTRFSKWIKETALTKPLTEAEISDKMTELRSQGDKYVDDSFPAIVGFNANAAMMHYIPTHENAATVDGPGVVLIDTGGHYLGGTTDNTRTFIVGEVSEQIKIDFTTVVRSYIGLSKAVFLKGTSGKDLDILARLPMWENGLDYKCGTGHGVGYLLSVHEGPQSFSSPVQLVPGMIITDEPGIYKEGEHGIRIENMLLVVPHSQDETNTFYKFEAITYCPIDLDGIVPELLLESERLWLNDYHQRVYDVLCPYLNEEERIWLEANTRAI